MLKFSVNRNCINNNDKNHQRDYGGGGNKKLTLSPDVEAPSIAMGKICFCWFVPLSPLPPVALALAVVVVSSISCKEKVNNKWKIKKYYNLAPTTREKDNEKTYS